MEWLPGGNTVLASFLLVRKVDPNVPFPIETASDQANSRAKGKSTKSKKSDKKKKGDDKAKEEPKEQENANQPASSNPDPSSTAPESKPTATETEKPAEAQSDKPTAAPDNNNNNLDSKPTQANPESNTILKEYYQPVTFRITSANPKVLEPLARVVKPADEVRKYMNEIMDRAERAPDGFLALRLPREGVETEKENEESKKGGANGTPVPVSGARKSSRGKNVVVEQEDVVDTENEGIGAVEEEEEELKDYYGPPTGLSLW